MGSVELAANLFRISQTEQKLKKDNINGESNANEIHYSIWKIVRNAIKKASGTMPEKLPTPNKSLKEIEKEYNNTIVNNTLDIYFTDIFLTFSKIYIIMI